MIESIGIYTILYILFALCVIYPPNEFYSSGLTAERLLGYFLGDEHLHFVQYHIKRTCINLIVHSSLPFFYFLYLDFFKQGPSIFVNFSNYPFYWQIGFSVSVLLPIAVVTIIMFWMQNDWQRHPIVRTLSIYNAADWKSVASTIDIEYRRVDKFSVLLGGIRRVIVTDSWVLLVDIYHLQLSQQSDVNLCVTQADAHDISHLSDTSVQFINIQVKNVVKKDINPFTLRLNSLDYRDLRSKLQSPITLARDVIIHQSDSEKFVIAFIEEAEKNPRMQLAEEERQRLDVCLGCSMVTANVRLEKSCIDEPEVRHNAEGQAIPLCRQCYCRPMWCMACMGRWFSARQDQQRTDTWLSGKSPCPTCRATFCLLDVRLVE